MINPFTSKSKYYSNVHLQDRDHNHHNHGLFIKLIADVPPSNMGINRSLNK